VERTLIIIKPDGVQRGLTGEIIRRFEQRGLKIAGMKFMVVPRTLRGPCELYCLRSGCGNGARRHERC
jgi:hypothetical protein